MISGRQVQDADYFSRNPSHLELVADGVRATDFQIARRSIANYLREFPLEQRDARFIEALEVGVFCVERATAMHDFDFVRSEVDSLLSVVERRVSEIPNALEERLMAQLGSDGQLLAPVRSMVELSSGLITERLNAVKDLLTNEIDPSKRTSTLGRALDGLRNLLDPQRADSIYVALSGAVSSLTATDGVLTRGVRQTVEDAVRPLADEVNRISKQIAGAEAARAVLASTPSKGAKFEEEVVALILPRVVAMGGQLDHSGPDNRPGDIVIRFGEASVAAGLCVVVEVRDRNAAVGRVAIAQVAQNAMLIRGANAAIYLSREPSGLAAEIGDWAEGECDSGPWVAATNEHLVVAIRFLLVLHRLKVLTQKTEVVDTAAVEAQVERIRTSLRRLGTVKRNVTAIRQSAGAIQDEIETLTADVRSALIAIEEGARVVGDVALARPTDKSGDADEQVVIVGN